MFRTVGFQPRCCLAAAARIDPAAQELFQLRLEGLELLAVARCEGREAAGEPRLMGVPWREEPRVSIADGTKSRAKTGKNYGTQITKTHLSDIHPIWQKN